MIRASAFPKLTLSLRVLGRRDDGYHDIEALTVSLSGPIDVVDIEVADETTLAVEGPMATGVPADASNLAWRAADALGAPLELRIHKWIPSGAGLGGGSANAAAVLVAMNGDEAMGVALGSDVPFCMRGGAAWVRGRGELLEPTTVPPLQFLVAIPDFRCSTPAVYAAWDELGGPAGRIVEIDGLPLLTNDLEPAAEHIEPRLREFREHVERVTGRPALLAGSGSAYVVPWRTDDLPVIEAPVVFEATTSDIGVSYIEIV
ncbi:MAG: 4-(cytidine 5'-diphospho)-2-C-methyl-D-erythritol kinase [Actinomycetota bacterium]